MFSLLISRQYQNAADTQTDKETDRHQATA